MSHGELTTHEQFHNLYSGRSGRGSSCGCCTVCSWIANLYVSHQEVCL